MAARLEGLAAGEGTAPEPRRPSQRRTAHPPGTAFHHPRGTQPPAGHASQRDSAGPPHPHTRAHSSWVADPDSPHRGRAAGGGTAPEFRRSSQRRKAAPLGTPSRHPRSAQQRLGASAGSPRPHQPHPGNTGCGALAARPKERAAGGETAHDSRHPSGRWKATPPRGRPPTTPAACSLPQGIQTKGTGLGPQARAPAPTARGWRTPTACPEDGQPGEGERLTSDDPRNGAGHRPGTPSRLTRTCDAGRPCQYHPCHTGNRGSA